jgi:TRAP-type C4-dicarboxylate transport system permease small subunit
MPPAPPSPLPPAEGVERAGPAGGVAAALERLALGFAMAGGGVLGLVVLVTTANAAAFILDRIARLLGANVPALPGYEEFAALATGCAAILFLPLCQARAGHVAVDVLIARAPAGVQRALGRLWAGLTAAVAAALAWAMLLGLGTLRADGAITAVLGWPVWPFLVPAVAALGLWSAVAAAQVFGPESRGARG